MLHADFGQVDTSQYVRLEVEDSPGVLAAIADAFGQGTLGSYIDAHSSASVIAHACAGERQPKTGL